MTISNAKIISTHLGFEDHGIFTFILTVQYGDNSCQGIGLIAMDTPNHDEQGKFIGRIATREGMQMIMDILETVGVDRWERLQHQHVRVEHEGWGSSATRIGHITEDRWFKIGG